jgi:hypothetical protein
LILVRLLLLAGWGLTIVGYYGPWIAHHTAALTLSGVDMGEFAKFLPDVVDGSLKAVRQLFYLPPVAVVVCVALLIGARRLRFSWPLRVLALAVSVPVSLQVLPPAWSPASLVTAEFRVQTIALGICWLLLAGFWWLGRLPIRLTSSLAAVLSLLAGVLSFWQFVVVKTAVDQVYHTPPPTGWGFAVCMIGLAAMTGAGLALLAQARQSNGGSWSGH